MDLMNAIYERRSIRDFTDYYVTDEEVNKLLDTAQWAPSWANTQAWEFVVVRDKDLINKITEEYSPTNPGRPCSFACSALIIACARKGISGCKQGVERTKFNNWFMFDLGMAVQNIGLVAHDLNLGTVIVGSMNHKNIGELINLPGDREVVVAIPVGRPTESSLQKGTPKRKELSDFCKLNTY